MRFLYVSRQFNRSGYYILEEMLKEKVFPTAILLPELNQNEALDNEEEALKVKNNYFEKCIRDKIEPLRFFGSIFLLAKSFNIPVFIRKSIKRPEDLIWTQSLDLDLIVLGGGWPELIPNEIIKMPKLGVINTHPSLLPEFRGTDIHRWQVLFGVKKSGCTIHYIDETFDTGEIVGKSEVDILSTDTPQLLFEKTAKASGKLMISILEEIEKAAPNKIKGTPQTGRNDKSRYFSRWRFENQNFLKIDFSQTAEEIYFKILACTQEDKKYNGSWARIGNEKYIFRSASPNFIKGINAEPGSILNQIKSGLFIACGKSTCIEIKTIQKATQKGYPEEPQESEVIFGIDFVNQLKINKKFE